MKFEAGSATQRIKLLNSLGSTVQRLLRERRARAAAFASARDEARPALLQERTASGTNPGALRMLVQPAPARGAPLVVVLHGCTQNGAAFAVGSGWSALAAQAGIALLLPEQRQANNPLGCFNWFEPADTRRGSGEALSIREMIAQMVATDGVDPSRVFVTGLSAGGAMTAALLATYPETFAGGAILAGLPHDAAGNQKAAFAAMGGRGAAPPRGWPAAVRAASPHQGPWPRIAIWHGSADTTVAPSNADTLVEQWRGVHGLLPAPDVAMRVGRHLQRVWRGADGRPLIEDWRIAGMAHGVPLDASAGWGTPGPYLLDAGIDSTWRIAQSWGLAEGLAEPQPRAAASAVPGWSAPGATDPGSVIEKALRAAGLR